MRNPADKPPPYSAAGGLECPACRRRFPLDPLVMGCPACEGPLEVAYDLGKISSDSWVDRGAPGIWRYHRLLPLLEPANVVSMGEGRTPLLPLVDGVRGGSQVAGISAWLKIEGQNPTGSFKDRLNSVAVSMASAFGLKRLICTSTGNHGASLAAYGRRSGMRVAVIGEGEFTEAAVKEIVHFEGTPLLAAESVQASVVMAELWTKYGWFPSVRNFPRRPDRPLGNPYGAEGYKTIAYEIVSDLGEEVPDVVLVPVGGGDGIWGIWRGFLDLQRLGVIRAVPRIVACQASASASLTNAVQDGRQRVWPIEVGVSRARSILARQTGDHALRAVTESRGGALAISEEQLHQALEIGRSNGISMDPASAVSVAGLEELVRLGTLSAGMSAVAVVTAHGYRWPHAWLPPERGAGLKRVQSDEELIQELGR